MPLVSVIIVFHRDTPYLRPAIASVLTQSFRDFELLLIDNGMGLPIETLGELGNDPRVRVVRLARDEGIGVAANAGVAVAQGELVAFCDYDDLSLPQRFERQVAALRAEPRCGLVSALAQRIDQHGQLLPAGTGVFTLLRSQEFFAYSQYAAPVIHPLSMVRREVLMALPFRREFRFTSELDFQARAVERWPFMVLPEVLMHYRWYPAQTTQRYTSNIDQCRCAINLLTARRRAGRPENIDTITAISDAISAGEYSRRTAEQCLAEGFPVAAAYLARRAFALERTWRTAAHAMRLASCAWRSARGANDRALVPRMFFTGPVKALGVHPA